MSPKKGLLNSRKYIFQPSFFQSKLLVFRGVCGPYRESHPFQEVTSAAEIASFFVADRDPRFVVEISHSKCIRMVYMYIYSIYIYPGIPTTIKTMGVNTTTIAYLLVLIIEIGSTIILMVVEAQGIYIYLK